MAVQLKLIENLLLILWT